MDHLARPDVQRSERIGGPHPSTRQAVRDRGIRFTCPERSDRIVYRKAKGRYDGRPPVFDSEQYRDRNVVERCFNKFKQFRDLATRYAKRLACWRSELVIASISLWLRESQDTA
jgi:transposase